MSTTSFSGDTVEWATATAFRHLDGTASTNLRAILHKLRGPTSAPPVWLLATAIV